uniref:Transmembrane protein n=1 Tax=Pithovirus LCPAC403 TaxID=2506596 RepID=A0A481ZAN5_9VIRU|nr:MAG: transmembrane protein [Pithovirus LCPAC403]
MGNAQQKKIDLNQVCSSNYDPNYELPGFCTLVTKDGIRDTFCKKIGKDSGEWVFGRRGGGCQYNDCNETNQLSGCNGSCCGFSGRKDLCKRTSFKASPFECCVQDFDNVKTAGLCFITNSDKNVDTCNPNYRSLAGDRGALQLNGSTSGQSCREMLFDFCTILDASRWSGVDSICVRAIDRNLFGDNTKRLSISSGIPVTDSSDFTSASGITWSNSVIDQLTKNIYANDQALGVQPGSTFSSDFESVILKACLTAPGICTDALTNTVCVNESETSLAFNPFRVPYCGCYLNDASYAQYINEFQITKSCSPPCNRGGNIGLVEVDGATLITCKQSVCIIDNVNVSITNAQAQIGNVTFNQTCQACGSGDDSICQCIITDETIIASGTINNINISQNCGSVENVCSDATGNLTNCETGEPLTRPPDVPVDTTTDFTTNHTMIIIAVVITIILILAILIEIIVKNRK